ncbi:ABC transporter ATP-binding protein [Paenibacillus castaneae]|uniref:ABC transporter ATP-binding protein n=1 Tax=Paenibacillus castaneae TaxID=474957 RepID=UPI000C9AD6F7|nr:ABC transporter ATP-binding protein [Paenibacillus castaneae]
MNHIIYFTKKLQNYGGRALYFNLFGMMVIGLLDGIGILLLVPLLTVIGILDIQIAPISGAGYVEFLQHMSKIPALMIVLSLFLILVIAQSLISRKLGIRETQLLTGFINSVRLEIYSSFLQAHWSFFVKRRKSDLITSLTENLGRVTNGAYLVLQFIASIAFTIIQIGIAFVISAKMTLFILGFGMIVIFLSRRFIKQSQYLGSEAISLYQGYMAGITDHFNGMKDIKSNSLEASRYRWMQDWTRKQAKERYNNSRVRGNSQLIYKLTSSFMIAVFIFFSVTLFQQEGGYLLLIIAIFARLWPRVTGIQSNLELISSSMPAFKSLMELHEECLSAQEVTNVMLYEMESAEELKLEKSLECRHVYFRYDQEQPHYTLEDINLQIPANGMTAIVGQSGAGKSTLVDLMMGLMKPELGKVLIDDKVLTDQDILFLRKSISYVPQDPFLFHGSIRDNLLMIDPNASEDGMWEAMEFSSAAEFVQKLPQGLDTVIGDRGVRLSGGERQRLVLARAILRKPTILILDEATSALDTVNETKIQQAIERLKGRMTVIIIAHRLTTIRNSDQVIVLDKGSIVQAGSFTKLSEDKSGLFSSLLGNQLKLAL